MRRRASRAVFPRGAREQSVAHRSFPCSAWERLLGRSASGDLWQASISMSGATQSVAGCIPTRSAGTICSPPLVPTLRVGMPPGTLRVRRSWQASMSVSGATQSVAGCIPRRSAGTICRPATRSHAPRGNASWDAPRPAIGGKRPCPCTMQRRASRAVFPRGAWEQSVGPPLVPMLCVGTPPGTLRVRRSWQASISMSGATQSVAGCIPTRSMGTICSPPLVPTLRVGMPLGTLRVQLSAASVHVRVRCDAERRWLYSHAERGNNL